MAAAPSFAAVPRMAVAQFSAANTARDGTGSTTNVITAGAAGTKINEVVVKSTGQPADSVVTLFITDGSTTWIFDEIDLGAPSAGSTTAASYRASVRYDNLTLPTGWSLRAGVTVIPTSGLINVIALAADL